MDQSNLLETIVKFSNKSRSEDKEKKETLMKVHMFVKKVES